MQSFNFKAKPEYQLCPLERTLVIEENQAAVMIERRREFDIAWMRERVHRELLDAYERGILAQSVSKVS